MSDPLRTNPTNHSQASIDSDTERDAKIESLLLTGLDQYFGGRLRTSDRHLDARAVSRSKPRARARVHRARPQRDGRTAARVGRAASQRRGGVRAWRDRGGAPAVECRGPARRRSRCGAGVPHANRPHSRRDANGARGRGAPVEIAVPAAHGDVESVGAAVVERHVRGRPSSGSCGRRRDRAGSASRLDSRSEHRPSRALLPRGSCRSR